MQRPTSGRSQGWGAEREQCVSSRPDAGATLPGMTRDELERLLDEYATLHTRHTSRGPGGTYRSYGPSRERRDRAAEIRERILDAVTPDD